MFFNTYIAYEQFLDLIVTFLFLLILSLFGNFTRVRFDKKFHLCKTDLLLSSSMFTLIVMLIAKEILAKIPLNIFILLFVASSAYSYEITISFLKNQSYKLILRIINGILGGLSNPTNDETKKNE